MKIAALMLAAGQSKRFNGVKQLAEIHGTPMLLHTAKQLTNDGELLADLNEFNIVLGAYAPKIMPILPPYLTPIVCQNWAQGMGASLAFGVAHLKPDSTHLLVMLADQVAILHEHIKIMLHYCHTMPEMIIAARYNKLVGAPVIFPRRYFASLLALNGDSGARKILQQHANDVMAVDIPTAMYDIDTQKELSAWRQSAN